MRPSNLQAEVAVWLAHTRESRGVSQEALASQIGKSQSFIAKVEKGSLRVTLLTFIDWVTALGVPDQDVMEFVRGLQASASTASLWSGER